MALRTRRVTALGRRGRLGGQGPGGSSRKSSTSDAAQSFSDLVAKLGKLEIALHFAQVFAMTQQLNVEWPKAWTVGLELAALAARAQLRGRLARARGRPVDLPGRARAQRAARLPVPVLRLRVLLGGRSRVEDPPRRERRAEAADAAHRHVVESQHDRRARLFHDSASCSTQDAERGFGTTCAILIAVPASLWALASLFSLAPAARRTSSRAQEGRDRHRDAARGVHRATNSSSRCARRCARSPSSRCSGCTCRSRSSCWTSSWLRTRGATGRSWCSPPRAGSSTSIMPTLMLREAAGDTRKRRRRVSRRPTRRSARKPGRAAQAPDADDADVATKKGGDLPHKEICLTQETRDRR